MANDMNLAVGVNFDLLQTNLSAMYEKTDKGSRILLMPTTVTAPKTVTMDEMVAEFQKSFGMEGAQAAIENNLNGVQQGGKTFDWKKIKFQLQAAFLYKEITPDEQKAADAKAQAQAQNKPAQQNGQASATATEKGVTEYAFAIAVNVEEALPSLGFFQLKSLYFAVWNTQRQRVLTQMGTGSITRLLQQLDA